MYIILILLSIYLQFIRSKCHTVVIVDHSSLVSRPSSAQAFDCLQHAKIKSWSQGRPGNEATIKPGIFAEDNSARKQCHQHQLKENRLCLELE